MKKSVFALIGALIISPVFASDYIPEVTTSEVYYSNQQQVQVVADNYDKDCNKDMPATYEYKLKPVIVHTGKTVVVRNHYAVYQPKVVYEKVNTYTTETTCEYCD